MKSKNPISSNPIVAIILPGLVSLLSAAALGQASSPAADASHFRDFIARIANEKDSLKKGELAGQLLAGVKARGTPPIEDSIVYFLYQGNARRVSVPGDLNRWNPQADTMQRIPQTDLFYLAKTVDPKARFEYKLLVDTVWMLDPLNPREAVGGYGPNSEIRMPEYQPPPDVEYRAAIPHGRIDTIAFTSRILRRTHPVFIYTPHNFAGTHHSLPTIYVTDGGEYISLALMVNVLDNLISDRRIEPVVAVFVDPRTNPGDAGTSTRMTDYTLSDTFVNFLVTELRDSLLKKYGLERTPGKTGIMGASLGGLIATYAAFAHPDVFGLCAAQSPSYSWKDETMVRMLENAPKKPIRFYIDTGTIHDAQEHARKMKEVLKQKGYELSYGEYPEGHNWVNWRARIDDILVYFYGVK